MTTSKTADKDLGKESPFHLRSVRCNTKVVNRATHQSSDTTRPRPAVAGDETLLLFLFLFLFVTCYILNQRSRMHENDISHEPVRALSIKR